MLMTKYTQYKFLQNWMVAMADGARQTQGADVGGKFRHIIQAIAISQGGFRVQQIRHAKLKSQMSKANARNKIQAAAISYARLRISCFAISHAGFRVSKLQTEL